ncbi:hypothetical protein FACS1894195_5050 [Bacteroidia bacterium]|nr:hypothetical protein FACS1894195_5050 [Bacteroidia bacterium]
MGVVFYLNGLYVKKHPDSDIKKSRKLSSMIIAEEAVKLYGKKTSQALRLIGVVFIILAFAQYWIDSPEFSLLALLAPLLPFSIYIYCCRKILTGKIHVVPMVLVSLLLLTISAFLGISYVEPLISVDCEKINISGLYGEEIPLNQLSAIFLADTLPNIGMRANGISTGTVNRGYFYSKSLKKNVKLLLHSSTKPYIYIITSDNKYIIVNFKNKEKIILTYLKLKKYVLEK